MIRVTAQNGRRPDGAAFFVAALLAGLGGMLIWQARAIADKGGYSGVGSGDAPLFIGWGLIALALAHLVKGLCQAGPSLPRQHAMPLLLIIGGLAAQLILLKPLGFAIASGLLFACTAAAFGRRNWLLTLPAGFGLALLVYGIFDRLLQLNLPAGLPETLIFGG
ncbi:MAG: hypothetical protein RIT14_2154 [Pseudomonadota bacterium]|jgi:putative tricarboxylic transport membrane protein